MPDHIHVLLTPKTSLEKAVQFIKGGFSYRAKKELGSNMEVWQKGFSDRRIRDVDDYREHVLYIRENPVRKRLCERAEEYPYSSAYPGFVLDPVPQGLKPVLDRGSYGAAEAAPFQSKSASDQNNSTDQSKGAPDRDNSTGQNKPAGKVEAARFLDKPGKIAS
jgi:putative transposase